MAAMRNSETQLSLGHVHNSGVYLAIIICTISAYTDTCKKVKCNFYPYQYYNYNNYTNISSYASLGIANLI